MATCPRCGIDLERPFAPTGRYWDCSACGGRAYTLPVLRKHLAEEFVRDVWKAATDTEERPGRACPTCGRPMAPAQPRFDVPQVEVCTICHLVWFDPGAFDTAAEDVPFTPPPVRSLSDLPPAAAEKMSDLHADLIERQVLHDEGLVEAPAGWQRVIALLCLPVELCAGARARTPWVTWVLAGAIIATWFATMNAHRAAAEEYGFVPAQPWRLHGLTPMTSFFLHGSVVHLLGNLYFFITFGDNVEVRLGPLKFLVLLALSTCAGDALHGLVHAGDTVPAIGASAGISGLLVYYACAFPLARLGMYIYYMLVPRWLTLPAVTFVPFWFFLQLGYVVLETSGATNVSATSHIGGAAVGVFFGLIWRK